MGAGVEPDADAPVPVFIESVNPTEDFEVLRSHCVISIACEPTPYAFSPKVATLDPDGNRIEFGQPQRDRPRAWVFPAVRR